MLGDKDGYLALGIALGFLGAFAALIWLNGAAHLGYCATDESYGACFREWIGALSGWAATFAAVITVLLLLRQLMDARLSNERQQRAYVFVGQCRINGAIQGPIFIQVDFLRIMVRPRQKSLTSQGRFSLPIVVGTESVNRIFYTSLGALLRRR
ncbi:exported hypothetical protein [Mesorhizobium sp. SOD10]|nr:exported hypothetical protein [Mesorhizobium sp. SOD10]